MPSAFRYSTQIGKTTTVTRHNRSGQQHHGDLRKFTRLNLSADVDPRATAINFHANAGQMRRKEQNDIDDQEQRGIARKGVIIHACDEHEQDHTHRNA